MHSHIITFMMDVVINYGNTHRILILMWINHVNGTYKTKGL